MAESENLNIFPGVTIDSGFHLLHANETLKIQEGANITSKKHYSCNTEPRMADQFTCMPKNAPKADKLDYDTILNRFHEQFPTYGGSAEAFEHLLLENLWGGLSSNYSTYILALGEADITGANISGSRIGLCAANAELIDSKFDTSERGCPPDMGLGKGLQYGACAGSGGANGGQGGAGGLDSSTKEWESVCSDKVATPYSYDVSLEGSGGASGSTSNAFFEGGAGGGIVRMHVLNQINMSNSQILANGGAGKQDSTEKAFGSGGGAGGTININTRSLRGSSRIEAIGGDGSQGGGGGGAGGRLAIHYNDDYKHSAQPEQSHYWRGTYSIAGGLAGPIDASKDYSAGQPGQTGVVHSSKCFGGYSGPFCQPCAAGTFKYDFSYAVCKPCENKPTNAYYTGLGASTSNCPYECSSGLDPYEVNPYCANALELQVNRLGGVTSSLLVSALFGVVVLFLFVALISHSKWILRADKSFRSTVYDGVLFNTDAEEDPSEDIAGPRNLKMNDSDIWSHTHRMYLIGENSINFPWYLPKDFPSRALNPENKDKLIRFIKSRQEVLNWTGIQKDTYVLTRVLCPPLANLIHRCFRKRHFTAL